MTRPASIVLALALVLGVAACDKPTPEDCKKALINMQHLLGTENLSTDANLQGEIRRCRGGSKRAAVACAIKAQTLDELRACDFEKVPGKPPLQPVGGGTAPAPAPSAGSAGSATTGSATTGSAGSATTGSAAGSAQ